MGHRFVQDLTSDVMFEADGASLGELFSSAAQALFELTCQTKKVKAMKSINITVRADGVQHLLQDFLNEIIAQMDIHSMFFVAIAIKKITKTELQATLKGDAITPEVGETVAKAVSNYNFSVRKTAKGYKATVVIDI